MIEYASAYYSCTNSDFGTHRSHGALLESHLSGRGGMLGNDFSWNDS